MSDISREEMIWNEAQMFARDIISSAWLDVPYADLPEQVRKQFVSLISQDIPRNMFDAP